MSNPPTGDLLIEAEEFDDYGGWVLDSQFDTEMGSPYLLAHGSGRPVTDACTVVDIEEPGCYSVWVRAKDWVPAHHPGRFELSLGNNRLATEFGANGKDWSWQSAGSIGLEAGPLKVTLHDLTGFDGRCDAIFLSRDGGAPIDGTSSDARAWRRRLRGIPDEPTPEGPLRSGHRRRRGHWLGRRPSGGAPRVASRRGPEPARTRRERQRRNRDWTARRERGHGG